MASREIWERSAFARLLGMGFTGSYPTILFEKVDSCFNFGSIFPVENMGGAQEYQESQSSSGRASWDLLVHKHITRLTSSLKQSPIHSSVLRDEG